MESCVTWDQLGTTTMGVDDVVRVVCCGRLPTVRESQGKSGKTERVREKSGNFKMPLTRPVIYALYSQFLPASGALPPDPHWGSAPNTAG